MFTQREYQAVMGTIQSMINPLEARIEKLTKQVEELQNAKVERPKTSTSRGKRVQQTKADA